MKLEGEKTIAAPREVVWQALNDETLLIECIPGCEALERINDSELAASMTAAVGPVKARFKGEVRLENVNPPMAYTLIGQGKGAAGFARGRADVALHENGPDETHLAYSLEASVGGKLAQVGARLIESTARQYTENFFQTFSSLVAERAGGAEPKAAAAEAEGQRAAPGPVEAEPRQGLHPLVWATLLILIVLGLLYVFGS